MRELVLLGLFAGGLPLAHTHSYLALVLFSAGACAYCVATTPRGGRWEGVPAVGFCTGPSRRRCRFRS